MSAMPKTRHALVQSSEIASLYWVVKQKLNYKIDW